MQALLRLAPVRAPLFRRLLLAALFLVAGMAGAQSSSLVDRVTAFFDSVAKPIYTVAWPTATYRTFHLDGIDPVAGGYDVLVTLSGNSGFGGGNLWLQLVVEVRNWTVHDVHVRRHNAILQDPFVTARTTAQFAAALAEEQARENAAGRASAPQPTPTGSFRPAPAPGAGAACVVNATGYDVIFDYRWGASEWTRYTLPPDRSVTLSWKYESAERSSPQLAIRYDEDLSSGYRERLYNLDRTQVPLPASCENASTYRFGVEGANLALHTASPGNQ